MSVPFCGKQNGRNGASAVVQMRKSPTEDGAEVSPLVSMLGVSLRRASVLKAATVFDPNALVLYFWYYQRML